jgi:hypothetical protein
MLFTINHVVTADAIKGASRDTGTVLFLYRLLFYRLIFSGLAFVGWC